MSESAPAQGIPETLSALRRTAGALSRLAEAELELTGSLLMRAALMACVAAACLAATVAVATAAVVSLLVAAGLSWPAATLLTLALLLVATLISLLLCRRSLRESALPATRRQIRALLPVNEEPTP